MELIELDVNLTTLSSFSVKKETKTKKIKRKVRNLHDFF